MARYRAAVIGLGRIGWAMEADERRPKPATHVGAWLACPRTELVAVCDADAKRIGFASRLGFLGLVSSDASEMLAAPNIESVSVATPAETHRAIVAPCAAAGVTAIVCEKPLAPTSADCRAMIAACVASGSRLFVNHSRRFDPLLRAAAAEVPEQLGEIVQVVGHYSGGLWNSGVHMVDLIRMLCGEVAWALGEWCRPFDNAPDPGYNATLQLEHGERVTLLAHDVRDYAIFDLHVYGRRGALHMTDSSFTVAWESTEDHAEFSGYRRLSSPLYVAGGESRSFMAPMAEHVCDVLDGVAEPVSTGEDGLMAVRVLEAIQSTGHGSSKHV